MSPAQKKVKKGFLGIRYSSSLALWVSIIAIFLEAISSVFLLLSLGASEGGIIQPTARNFFLTLSMILQVIIAILILLSLFTPLYEFLPYVLKVFESLMFVFITFGLVFLTSYFNSENVFYYQNSFASTIIFVVSFIIFYLRYWFKYKKLGALESHKNAINKLNAIILRASETLKDRRVVESLLEVNNLVNLTLNDIVNKEIAERGDVSKILYVSTMFAGAFYLGNFALYQYSMTVSTLVLIFSYALIALLSIMALVLDAAVLRTKGYLKA